MSERASLEASYSERYPAEIVEAALQDICQMNQPELFDTVRDLGVVYARTTSFGFATTEDMDHAFCEYEEDSVFQQGLGRDSELSHVAAEVTSPTWP